MPHHNQQPSQMGKIDVNQLDIECHPDSNDFFILQWVKWFVHTKLVKSRKLQKWHNYDRTTKQDFQFSLLVTKLFEQQFSLRMYKANWIQIY